MAEPVERFPKSVYSVGTEPDARFTLANERTFLAWNRTALALIAGGVALEAFGLDLHEGLRLAASLTLMASGMMIPLLAWRGWAATERALRLSRPLPASPLSILLAAVISIVGVAVVLGVLLR